MKRYQWGILGTSFISGVMADAIVQEGNSDIHSVAGRSLAPLQDFAEKYQVKHSYQDFDAFVQDPAVDIIYIALPNHLHAEWVIKAAKAGKAIFVRKVTVGRYAKHLGSFKSGGRGRGIFLGRPDVTSIIPWLPRLWTLLKQVQSVRSNLCRLITVRLSVPLLILVVRGPCLIWVAIQSPCCTLFCKAPLVTEYLTH